MALPDDYAAHRQTRTEEPHDASTRIRNADLGMTVDGRVLKARGTLVGVDAEAVMGDAVSSQSNLIMAGL